MDWVHLSRSLYGLKHEINNTPVVVRQYIGATVCFNLYFRPHRVQVLPVFPKIAARSLAKHTLANKMKVLFPSSQSQ